MKNHRPLLSVIVPVYNVAPYLEDALNALLAQTYQPLEIIVIDDGSTDGSEEICDRYETPSDPMLTCVHQAQKGVSSARNLGIELARGALVGFMDGDDWIAPNFYERLYADMCYFNADMATCGFVKIDQRSDLKYEEGGGDAILLTPEAAIRATFEKDQMRYSPCNKLYKRELFKSVRYPEDLAFEDKATTYRLMDACQRVSYRDAKLYHYFMRQDSAMRKPLTLKSFDLLSVNEQLIDFLAGRYPNLLETAKRSYAQECRWLLDRMEEEGAPFIEQRQRCEAVLKRFG